VNIDLRVERLILLAPANALVMPLPEGDDLFANARAQLSPDRQAEFDSFMASYFDFGGLFAHDENGLARRNLRLAAFLLEAMGGPPLTVPEPGAPVDCGGWMPYAVYLSLGRHHDYTDALALITADTLVVHGVRDLLPQVGGEVPGVRGVELLC